MNKLFQKNIQTSFFLLLFMMVGGFLFSGGTENVQASQPCVCYPSLPAKCFDDRVYSLAECSSACKSAGYASGELADADRKCSTTPKSALSNAIQNPLAPVAGWVKTALGAVFVGLLTAVLTFFGWLLSVAAMIFAWAADANSLRDVINNQNIYDSWKIIRDLLNIAFILVLLYTAFTIIFQVDSTNKKIILTVVLMALLVNFSFPITRFIIDIGNSLMYTIFKNLLPEANSNFSNIFSNISDTSSLGKIIDGAKTSGDIPQLIGSIVFVAIMAITFLMMSMLFVIRIVALAIIIIFSPIAFVGAAVPSMSSKTGPWWDYLFKYTFFGPAMALMLYIATQIMKTTQNAIGNAGDGFAPAGTGSLLTGMSTFAIPVVILWIGMGIAQKMGIEGAAMAQKFATKAFKFAALAPAKAGWYGMKKTGIPGGMDQKWQNFKKTGFLGSDRVAERAAKIAGGGPFKVKGAYEELERKKIAEKRKTWKDEGGATDKIISDALNSGDKIKMKAAAMEAAEKVGFGDKDHAHENYQKAKAAVADNPVMKALFDEKVKEKHIKLVIEDEWKSGTKTPAQAYADNLSGLTPDEMAKQKGLHENIEDDINLQNYIRDEVSTDKEYHKEFFKKLSRKQRAAYMSKGLHPDGGSQGGQQKPAEQPKKKMEDVERERAQKAQDDINKQAPQSMEEREKFRAQKAQEEIDKFNES